MTEDQRVKANELALCTFQPGSYQKRFVIAMLARARSESGGPLNERQAAYLDKLHHMYRKQIAAGKHLKHAALGEDVQP